MVKDWGKHFSKEMEKRRIPVDDNYPKSPKMIAFVKISIFDLPEKVFSPKRKDDNSNLYDGHMVKSSKTNIGIYNLASGAALSQLMRKPEGQNNHGLTRGYSGLLVSKNNQ